jgi:tRNA dimethylallyltransferase
VLEKKIEERLLQRINGGMVAEAKRLHSQGLSYKRMEALGLEYRFLSYFLRGEITRAQMIDQLNIAIRRYARRQLTYWKPNKDIRWFTSNQNQRIVECVGKWLRQ